MSLKESDLGGKDYDLSKFVWRVYVPRNYDPSIPCGIFVYLEDHDVWAVPTQWEPVLDKFHMIFICPDIHENEHVWETIGASFDAIDNLKRMYKIDTHRLYQMWFNRSLQYPLAGADVFTGMIVGENWDYFRRIDMPNGSYYPADADFPPPPPDLFQKAKPHGVVLVTMAPHPDTGAPEIVLALKQDGFENVLSIAIPDDQLHYPNLAAGWITDPVLPFLDKAAMEKPEVVSDSQTPASAASSPAEDAGAAPASAPSSASSSGSTEAQHLLSMAKLYISNGDTELARSKLKAILSGFPKDPAAIAAKKLLDSLPPPVAPQQ